MANFSVTLSGDQWWKVLRVLTGEAPTGDSTRDLANEISAQLWDGPEPTD